MAPVVEQRRRAERLVTLAASLQAVTQAPPPRVRRTRWPWISALCLSLVFGALPFVRGLRPVDFLIRRWQTQSHLLSDVEAAARVRELPALGEDGLQLLVQALTDSRAVVAEAAVEILEQEVSDWKQLPLADASRRAARLLGLLRSHSSEISPVISENVRSVVLEILRWPVDDKNVDATVLVADCEYVLARLYRPPVNSIAERHSSVGWPSDPTSSVTIAAEGPGLESQATEEPGSESQATQEVESEPQPTEGPTFTIADDVPVSTRVGSTKSTEPALVAPLPPRATSLENTPDSQLKDEQLIALGEQLWDARADVVVAATNELKRRGFRPNHISLIEQLFDERPNVRRAALDELPRISGFDSRPWLWHLAEDSDASVRRTAVALMRTSADPLAKKKLRELETR